MPTPNNRLTPVSRADLYHLQGQADELAQLQTVLDRLMPGFAVEHLAPDELDRLRQLASKPQETLAGPHLLRWHNAARVRAGV